MSGPVRIEDAPPDGDDAPASPPRVDVSDGREVEVGGFRVRRALPRRKRRTIGAWCFADHLGPGSVTEDDGLDIGPHPHIGLQTVTWLAAGEVLHRDSLGSEQPIRPGQLNLMTAGRGVSHSEEHTGRYRGDLHGIQLWVAQPEWTRGGAPAFEHHDDLPEVDLEGATATVLVGELAGGTAPTRRDTDHAGADLAVRAGTAVVPLRSDYEHGLVLLEGEVVVDGSPVRPGQLAYLGSGRDELVVVAGAPARLVLLGGVPFGSRVLMWWNFVARTRDEVTLARRDWEAGADRFGDPGSPLDRMPAPPLPWA